MCREILQSRLDAAPTTSDCVCLGRRTPSLLASCGARLLCDAALLWAVTGDAAGARGPQMPHLRERGVGRSGGCCPERPSRGAHPGAWWPALLPPRSAQGEDGPNRQAPAVQRREAASLPAQAQGPPAGEHVCGAGLPAGARAGTACACADRPAGERAPLHSARCLPGALPGSLSL